MQDSLKRAKRASQEPPLSTQIAQIEAFVERAKKRLATHDAQREGLVQELESSQARLDRLRRLEVPTVVPGATDAESEIAALKAKLVQLQGEREEAVGERPRVRQRISDRCLDTEPMPYTTQELWEWMNRKQQELHDTLQFGGSRNVVLELTSQLAEAADRLHSLQDDVVM